MPSWNYVAIHAHSRLFSTQEAGLLLRHVDDLTRLTEAGRPDPWSIAGAPGHYIDAMLKDITGLRLGMATLEGVWKNAAPSSNRSPWRNRRIIGFTRPEQAMATAMRERESRQPANMARTT